MFVPAARMDRMPSANALPSQGSANTGSAVSGGTRPNPWRPPMSWIPSTRGSLPSASRARTGAGPCGYAVTDGTRCARLSHGPRVELEGAGPPRGERGVEDVQRVERLHPVDKVLLAEAIQGAHGEAARVDGRALLEQRLDLPVPRKVPGEALGADGRVAAVPGGQQDTWAVQDDRHIEALAHQAGRGKQVDQGNRALERDGVNEDERLLARVGPDVFEDFLLGVVERVG